LSDYKATWLPWLMVFSLSLSPFWLGTIQNIGRSLGHISSIVASPFLRHFNFPSPYIRTFLKACFHIPTCSIRCFNFPLPYIIWTSLKACFEVPTHSIKMTWSHHYIVPKCSLWHFDSYCLCLKNVMVIVEL